MTPDVDVARVSRSSMRATSTSVTTTSTTSTSMSLTSTSTSTSADDRERRPTEDDARDRVRGATAERTRDVFEYKKGIPTKFVMVWTLVNFSVRKIVFTPLYGVVDTLKNSEKATREHDLRIVYGELHDVTRPRNDIPGGRDERTRRHHACARRLIDSSGEKRVEFASNSIDRGESNVENTPRSHLIVVIIFHHHEASKSQPITSFPGCHSSFPLRE